MWSGLACQRAAGPLPALSRRHGAGSGFRAPAPFSQPASDTPRATLDRVHYFGDYELLEEIARGGMGIVYRARQVSLNRIVAMKMLLFGKFSSAEFVKRFQTDSNRSRRNSLGN